MDTVVGTVLAVRSGMLNDTDSKHQNQDTQTYPVISTMSTPTSSPSPADYQTLRQLLDEQQRKLDELTAQVARARGTRELPRPKTLVQRIESALRAEILGLEDLSKEVEHQSPKVAHVISELRAAGKVANVGTEERPRWTWKIGDATSTPDLQALVRRLMMHAPLTLAELVAATGARAPRVSGCIESIKRTGERILDVGVPGHGRWFLIGPNARDARVKK